jgi:hypothetical protein
MRQPYYVDRVRRKETTWELMCVGEGCVAKFFSAELAHKAADLLNDHSLSGGLFRLKPPAKASAAASAADSSSESRLSLSHTNLPLIISGT